MALLGASALAHAGVNLKNGNFYISYTDVYLTGGAGLELTRTYNSKSVEVGLFGMGWGSRYEVFLAAQLDGSIVVHEHGSGSRTVFWPVDSGAAATQSARRIADRKVERDGIDAAARAEYEQRLRNDAEFRARESEALGLTPRLEEIPLGARYLSRYANGHTVVRVPEGFRRDGWNGVVETFDLAGRLVRSSDSKGHFIELVRDDQGRIARLSDDVGQSVAFTYDEDGRLVRLDASNGGSAQYRYEGDDLVWSRDAGGNEYSYRFNREHNLTQIAYSDGSALQVGYSPADLFAAYVLDPKGEASTYEYFGGSLEYGTVLRKYAPDGKAVSKSGYHYFIGVAPSGERYTRQIVTELDGVTTRITYDERSLPLEIDRDGVVTRSQYDERGNVLREESPTQLNELTWTPEGKVASVRRSTREPGGSWTTTFEAAYRWDPSGNLLRVETPSGRTVVLDYDAQGRLAALKAAAVVRFVYEQSRFPVRIEVEGVGAVKASTQARQSSTALASECGGWNEDVTLTSAGTRKLADSTNAAIQEAIELVRPSGITLPF